MNNDIWCAFVNMLAHGTSSAASKAFCLTMMAGDTAAHTAAGTAIDTATAACTTLAQTALATREAASWYKLDSPLQTMEVLAGG